MAFIDITQLNDIQEVGGINEKRFSELGLLNATKASTPATSQFLSADARMKLQEISASTTLTLPVIKDQTVVVNSTPGFGNIPDNLPETDEYSFTVHDTFSGFRHFPSAYKNNVIASDFARSQVMRNVLYEMGNSIESTIAAQLELRKTQTLASTLQVSQGDGTFVFNGGTNTLEINKAAQKETMFSNLDTLMTANELAGVYRIATNRAGMAVQRTEAAKFGNANDKDLQNLMFFGNDRIHESGNISGGSDIFNGWLLRDGSIGLVENFPADFVSNTAFAGQEWSITDTDLPFVRMRANVYTNKQATNATALISPATDSNLIMTHFEEMAIWVRFYVVYPFNSDLVNRAQDIVKIKGLIT